jgi:hypothetical protein
MAGCVLASVLGGSRLLGQGGGAGLATWVWVPVRWAAWGGPATRAVGASQGRGPAGPWARAAAQEHEQGRAGRNTRGSLARSVRGQLGSARIGSFEFFHELS